MRSLQYFNKEFKYSLWLELIIIVVEQKTKNSKDNQVPISNRVCYKSILQFPIGRYMIGTLI